MRPGDHLDATMLCCAIVGFLDCWGMIVEVFRSSVFDTDVAKLRGFITSHLSDTAVVKPHPYF